MDYKETYDYWFFGTLEISSKKILKELKKAKSDDLAFNNILNSICQKVQEIRQKKYLEPADMALPGVHKIFNKRSKYYRNQVRNILSNEIINLYLKENNNTFNEKEISEIIKKIAISESLYDLINRFSGNSTYYQLVYKSEMWNCFTLDKIKGGLENTKNFKQMKEKLYPEPPLVKKSKTPEDNKEEDSLSESSINILEENERYLLIHLIAKRQIQLNQVEFIKLILTISPVNEQKMFTKKYANTRIYKISNEGINYFTNTEDQHKFIERLIKKVQNLNLGTVVTELKLIKASLPKLEV